MNKNQIKLQMDWGYTSCIVYDSANYDDHNFLESLGISIDTIHLMEAMGVVFNTAMDWQFGKPKTNLTPAYFKAYNSIKDLVVEQIYKEIGDKYEIENRLKSY
jgi:hypothetical protein